MFQKYTMCVHNFVSMLAGCIPSNPEPEPSIDFSTLCATSHSIIATRMFWKHTMADTTIVLQPSSTVFSTSGGLTLAPITTTAPGSYTVSFSSGFGLYIPYTVSGPTSVNVSALVQALGGVIAAAPPSPTSSIPWTAFSNSNNSTTASIPIASASSLSITSGSLTLYIPFTPSLTPTVDTTFVSSLFQALNNGQSVVAETLPSSDPPSTQSGLPGFLSSSNPPSTSSVSSNSLPTSSAATGSASTKPSKNRITGGVLVGGILGGVVFGLIVCSLIACWWSRRRPSRPTAMQAGPKDPSSRKPVPRETSKDEKTHIFESVTDVTGWRKHLPQEKDDGTLVKAFSSIFEQIQIHMEGFYEEKTGKLPSKAIESLESLSQNDTPRMLRQTDKALVLLESILVRWIISRISLRSIAEQSLLPLEYTKIPEQNKWHMESDKKEYGSAAESKKGQSYIDLTCILIR